MTIFLQKKIANFLISQIWKIIIIIIKEIKNTHGTWRLSNGKSDKWLQLLCWKSGELFDDNTWHIQQTWCSQFCFQRTKDKKPDQNKKHSLETSHQQLTPKGNLKHHLMFTIVLYTFKGLTSGLKSNAFCWQFCDAAKVGVIHRKISPNLATS